IGRYGGYDLLVKGLRAVRERFMPLVLPISVQNNQGDYSIGTGFLYSPDTIVTARHCIEGLQRISILLADQTAVSVDSVFFSASESLDIAIIRIPPIPGFNLPTFHIEAKPEHMGKREMDELNYVGEPSYILFAPGVILDDVLTMGYPPIAGFEAIHIADRSAINSSVFRTYAGEVLAIPKKYREDIEFLLINAKVKGGNSGGPVFDKLGRVVGMVVEAPKDFVNPDEIDHLGYGLALPSRYIKDMLDGIRSGDGSVIEQPVEQLKDGAFRVR
ncbi:MAG: hypothetical protein DI539_17585, partial [Flavobacterium psychrophilum]